jgi:hypothetical protein
MQESMQETPTAPAPPEAAEPVPALATKPPEATEPIPAVAVKDEFPAPQRATVGRIVHVHHRGLTGARPGIIVSLDPTPPRMNVNVFLDGHNDARTFAEIRASSVGDTLPNVTLYPPLTIEQRQRLVDAGVNWWAEWPPRD